MGCRQLHALGAYMGTRVLLMAVLIGILGVCGLAFSSVYRLPPLDEVWKAADAVLHVRIKSGYAQTFTERDRDEVCGVQYQADVLEAQKGTEIPAMLAFFSRLPLAVGGEYLLFLADTDIPSLSADEHHSAAFSSPSVSREFEECLQRLSGPAGNVAIRFSDWRSHGTRWLLVDQDSPRIPEGVRLMKVKCEAEADVCETVSEPVLLHWDSLREVAAARRW